MKDSHLKSVLKGFSWRLVGTIDTIVIAFFWTGDYSKALKIGAIEVFTKIALYYLHERIWLKIKWGKDNKDAHGKSVAKGFVWRVVAAIDTFGISYFILNESVDVFQLAAKITSTELVTKVPLYYLHERLWMRINIGNSKNEPEVSIAEVELDVEIDDK